MFYIKKFHVLFLGWNFFHKINFWILTDSFFIWFGTDVIRNREACQVMLRFLKTTILEQQYHKIDD